MKNIVPHFSIIFSLFSLTLLIIDRINDAMAFINNNIYKTILLIFFILMLIRSTIEVVMNSKRH
ncbi:MAG: hypothetical protein IKR03_02360 [Clostridia bacterium]|nr:hypothetical protein [Clostridia bacterium]